MSRLQARPPRRGRESGRTRRRFGARARNASVEFKVLVDGTEKYSSSLYLFGEKVLPVVVDVRGTKELKLVVTDGCDGIANDYAWWAEPRFLRE
jgi:hypothetical protein